MTNTGTCKYKAPEILGGFMSYYDERVDLWSCGAVLYYIVCGGIHAFPSNETKGKLSYSIINISYISPIAIYINTISLYRNRKRDPNRPVRARPRVIPKIIIRMQGPHFLAHEY